MTEFDRMQQEIEAAERWLRGFDDPEPSRDLAARIAAAVRAERRRDARQHTLWRSPAWVGGLAAAAMIALSAVVIERLGARYGAAAERVRMIEQITAALDVTARSDATLALMAEEIDDIGRSGRSELDSAIDALGDSIYSASGDPSSSL